MVVPFLNIPIISVVMMLLAGILIGNLIWYRDRSEDEALLVDLRGENNELQAALHEHKQAYVELEADLEDRRQESEQLKTVLRQLDQSRQEADHEKGELNDEIARLQQLKDQAFHDLDQERQQRRTLQESLSQAEASTNRTAQITEQLQDQLTAVQNEHDELKAAANARATQQEQASQQFQREFSNVEADRDDWRAKHATAHTALQTANQALQTVKQDLERTQHDLQVREAELESIRGDRDDLSKQVDDERTAREQLHEKVTQVEQLVAQRDRALEQLSATGTEVAELKQELAAATKGLQENRQRSHRELTVLRDENEQLEERLDTLGKEHEAVTTMLVDERSRLSKMEADNHHLSLVAADQSEKKDQLVQELRQQVDAQTSEVESLREELEGTAASLGHERHQREHLQIVLDKRQVELERQNRENRALSESVDTLQVRSSHLTREIDELHALRGEHASVKQILSGTHDQLAEARESCEAAMRQNQDLEKQRQELEVQMDEMTQRVAQVASVREDYGMQLSELQRTHEEVLADRRELEGKVEELAQDITRRQNSETEQLDELQQQKSEFETLRQTHREQQQRLEKLVAQRDEALATTAAADESLQELRSQLESQSRSLSAVHQQLAQYQSTQADYDALRQEHVTTTDGLKASEESLLETRQERDQALTQCAELQQALTQLEARAKANEETIRHLRRERQEVISRSRPAVPFAVPSVRQDTGGRLRRDEVLGLVYTQPPKHKDDLKQIQGIAQVLEKKLNAFGVYTYRQIMEWDEVAIAEFSKLLSFRDRIIRDDWVGQARELHFQTYGRAA